MITLLLVLVMVRSVVPVYATAADEGTATPAEVEAYASKSYVYELSETVPVALERITLLIKGAKRPIFWGGFVKCFLKKSG